MGRPRKNPLEETNSMSTEETNVPAPQESADSMIQISSAFLEDLINRVSAIEDRSGMRVIKEVSKNPKVRVRYHEGKLVTGYGRSYEGKDDLNKPVQRLEVFTGEEKHVVDQVYFMQNSETAEGEVVSQKRERIVKNYGDTTRTKVDWGSYRSVETNERVPLEAISYHTTFTVRLPGGKEVELDELALN